MAVAANVMSRWKGAVEPDAAGTGGNVIFLWKGAVEPATTIAALVGVVAPRDAMFTDEDRFDTFIAANVSALSGDKATDYREALLRAAGITTNFNDYSINDAFKRYFDSL